MPRRLRLPRRDIPAPMTAIMLEVAADFGVSAATALHGTAIDEAALSSPDTRVSIRDQSRMLDNCIAASAEPGFALHYGSRIPVVAIGVLGYALMCCRNVQELMEVLTRYHRLISGSFHIDVHSGEQLVEVRLLGGMLEANVQPLDCEVFFAAAAASLRRLGAVSDEALHVRLAYPEPVHGALYRQLICPDVRFDAGENLFAVDRRTLDMPLQFANPTLLRLYRAQCDELLAGLSRTAEFTGEVRRFLLASPGRFAPFEEAAAHLHVSPRTLRRRLEEEGTTYQRLVHELRRQIAETHLRDGVLSIGEIADMLGYTDSSNFRRAFISWTGRSPAHYRRGWRGDDTARLV
jgi:AraC-like DNA-binding protein